MQEYVFDAAKVRDNLVSAVSRIAKEQGFNKVVIGISGGKDSTVAAAICARALGKENVYGVMLPDKEQADINDSIRVCDALGINKRIINIGTVHAAIRAIADMEGSTAKDGEFSVEYSRESDINVGPRIRMIVLRYIGQAIGARLVGTGNLSEKTVGYCTKDGDTSCDFSLLGSLTSVEVVKVGLAMEELPSELVVKTPTDGLSGKSDEEKLGLLYSDIHKYIRYGTCGSAEIDAKISAKEKANMHKRVMPTVLDPFANEEN